MPKQDTTNHTKAKQFRLGTETLEKLDALASFYSVDRTSMLKVLIADAFKQAVTPPAKKNQKKSNLPS